MQIIGEMQIKKRFNQILFVNLHLKFNNLLLIYIQNEQ